MCEECHPWELVTGSINPAAQSLGTLINMANCKLENIHYIPMLGFLRYRGSVWMIVTNVDFYPFRVSVCHRNMDIQLGSLVHKRSPPKQQKGRGKDIIKLWNLPKRHRMFSKRVTHGRVILDLPTSTALWYAYIWSTWQFWRICTLPCMHNLWQIPEHVGLDCLLPSTIFERRLTNGHFFQVRSYENGYTIWIPDSHKIPPGA